MVKPTTRGELVWEYKSTRMHLNDTSHPDHNVHQPTDHRYWLIVIRQPKTGEVKYVLSNTARITSGVTPPPTAAAETGRLGRILRSVVVLKTAPAYVMLYLHPSASAMLNIRDTGAKADYQTDDAPAIQQAIDRVHEAGGGTVLVPPGRYLATTIRLRSRVTLHLEAGATIYASTRPEAYGQAPEATEADWSARGVLLLADQAEHIAVTGQGALDGQGVADLSRSQQSHDLFRTRLVLVQRCRQVSFRDVSLLNSDSWALHLSACDDVLIDGVRILANKRRINTDGIDPDGCSNVRISNCHIITGDDCIVIKSTRFSGRASENIVITNCTLESGASAIKLGTESFGDFRDIRVSNCTVRRSSTGLAIMVKDGATVERVGFQNISIDDWPEEDVPHTATPLILDLERRHHDSPLGRIRDITFRDLHIRSRFPALIQGHPERPIENLALMGLVYRMHDRIDFPSRIKRGGGHRTPKGDADTRYAQQPAAVAAAHIDGFQLGPLRVVCEDDAEPEHIAGVSLHHVRDLAMTGVSRSGGRGKVICRENVTILAESDR